MFWADEIADTIINRSKRPLYWVNDSKTPSGRIHVGALRGVVLHNMVARALATRGVTAKYTYGFDDYDAMDGFPVYLPESFRQYMGMPLSEIPSPEPGFTSFGHYYAQEFIDAFHDLGIAPEIYRTSEMYKTGQFNEAIRIALDKSEIIRKIYRETSGAERNDDWYPFQAICENCGKVGTTRVYAWDGERVSYRCEPNQVKWAEGCSHTGSTRPFDGTGKLHWKVEWAAKWFIFKHDFETAGKDHMTKNGSFDVTSRIVREVYGQEPPLGRAFPYEWLLIGGKKMSSSKGIGASAREVVSMLPPDLLHFYIAKVRPSRHLDFDPDGQTISLLYDEYDKALAAFHADPTSDLGKTMEYTHADTSRLPEYTMRFSKVAFLIQMPHVDLAKLAEEEKGTALTEPDRAELETRSVYARKWLDTYADEAVKFTLQNEKPPVQLSSEQRHYLAQLAEKLDDVEWTGGALHTSIHGLKNEMGLAPKEAFGALYQIFLAKDQGPQAGWFLAALDREFVMNRLREASEKE